MGKKAFNPVPFTLGPWPSTMDPDWQAAFDGIVADQAAAGRPLYGLLMVDLSPIPLEDQLEPGRRGQRDEAEAWIAAWVANAVGVIAHYRRASAGLRGAAPAQPGWPQRPPAAGASLVVCGPADGPPRPSAEVGPGRRDVGGRGAGGWPDGAPQRRGLCPGGDSGRPRVVRLAAAGLGPVAAWAMHPALDTPRGVGAGAAGSGSGFDGWQELSRFATAMRRRGGPETQVYVTGLAAWTGPGARAADEARAAAESGLAQRIAADDRFVVAVPSAWEGPLAPVQATRGGPEEPDDGGRGGLAGAAPGGTHRQPRPAARGAGGRRLRPAGGGAGRGGVGRVPARHRAGRRLLLQERHQGRLASGRGLEPGLRQPGRGRPHLRHRPRPGHGRRRRSGAPGATSSSSSTTCPTAAGSGRSTPT